MVTLVAIEPVVFNTGPELTPPVGFREIPCVEFETSNLYVGLVVPMPTLPSVISSESWIS